MCSTLSQSVIQYHDTYDYRVPMIFILGKLKKKKKKNGLSPTYLKKNPPPPNVDHVFFFILVLLFFSNIYTYFFTLKVKQERILSAGPTVYCTVTPPPHPHPSTHGQVVFASKRWRYEGKGKGGGEEIKFKKIGPPFFYRGPPPLYPLCRRPPYPLHRVFLFFLPHFFYRGPPLYPPIAAPPTPCTE